MDKDLLIKRLRNSGYNEEQVAQQLAMLGEQQGKKSGLAAGANAGPSNTASGSEGGLLELAMPNVPTADQMKQGVLGLTAEGDFVSKMNNIYKGTGIEFKESSAMQDAFTMYDSRTDEESEEISVPNIIDSITPSFGIDQWQLVQDGVKNFVNREARVDAKFQEQRNKASNIIATKLEDKEFMTNLLGEGYDFKYIEKPERGGKGEDYQKVLQALKEEVGSFGGFFGGTFVPGGEFSNMDEQAIESAISLGITKKYNQNEEQKKAERNEKQAAAFDENNLTYSKIDSLYKNNNPYLTKEQDLLRLGFEKLATLEPGSDEYKDQEEVIKGLRKDTEGIIKGWGTKRLIDPITGASINPESKEASTAVEVTAEELKELEGQLKLTYGDKIEQAFIETGRDRAYSDIRGEEVYGITINDPQAYRVFEELGYKPVGDNENGYEFEVKLKHLSRYYDATVKSDGFTFFDIATLDVAPEDQEQVGRDKFLPGATASLMGLFGVSDKASFKSPQGYFGLTEKVGEQKFTFGEQRFFDEDEYSEDDKSIAFKRMLKDYRDERFSLLKEGEVLSNMWLTNTDPASIKTLPGDRGVELILEGFEGMFGGSAVDTDIMTSKRDKLDILELSSSERGFSLTETQTDAIKRSSAYKVYEGVSGFVPAIAEFALIDLAIKKGVGVIPGAARTLSKLSRGTTLQKTMFHTYGIVKEELKMKQAFDEHYHLGGGTGFYAVGNLLPKFKTVSNRLNTFLNANKAGFGGALSTQAAANLEALARDIAGKESWQTWVKENYSDLNLTTEGFIVDYMVFALIGAKGWAFEGGKNWRNNFRGRDKLRKLERELREQNKELKDTIKQEEATLSPGKNIELINQTKQKLEKNQELLDGVSSKLNDLFKTSEWQDTEKANEALNRINENIKSVFPEHTVEIKAVNGRKDKNGNNKFTFDDSAAEFDGKNTIFVDVNKVTAGKLPHEVFHLVMQKLFKAKPEVMNMFKSSVESVFGNKKFFVDVEVKDAKGNLTGEKRNMTIEELIMNEHGSQKNFDDIKANEFTAYVAEILSNPRYYSDFVAGGVWKRLQLDINKFTNRHIGLNALENGSKQDIVDFIANFSRSVMSGTLTRKQVDMFKKIKADGVFGEAVEADSRTEQRIEEQKSTEAMNKPLSSKSVKLSAETQSKYESEIKGKEGRQLDASIDKLLMPDFNNPTSVAGKNFDNIIYQLIKDIYPEVYKNPDQRYTLALDMVYDLNSKEGSKNRGVKGIIKDYEAKPEFSITDRKQKDGSVKKVADIYDSEGNKRLTQKQVAELEAKYNAKFGTPEFIIQAKKEGYKGKQNLTKTVREMLIRRIHKMKRDALGQESDFEGLGYTRSVEEMSEMGMDIVDVKAEPFEFKSEDVGADYIRKIDPLNYINSRDLVRIRQNMTNYLRSNKALIDLRPFILAKNISPETVSIVEKAFGRVREVVDTEGNVTYEKVAKKDYYDVSKERFEKYEKEIYEAFLPESRDKYTSETTNAAKSAYARLYEPAGEFTFAELNKGIAGEILTRSQKAEGRMKMNKKPYRKGILNEIVFEGDRKDQHHKKMNYLMAHGGFAVSRKIVDMMLNNPKYADLLRTMSPGVYEGLKFNQVLTSVKENLRGTTSESLASKVVKLAADQYVEKIQKGQAARAAMLEVIAQNETLKPYKDFILKEMNLRTDDLKDFDQMFIKVGESKRIFDIVQGPQVKPLIFEGRFDGKKGNSVYKELNKIIDRLSEEGLLDKDLININEAKASRQRNKDFSRDFVEEFLPDFFNLFDSRLLNFEGKDRGGLGTTMGSGQERFGFMELVPHTTKKKIKGYKLNEETGLYEGFRYKIFDKQLRDGIFEGLEGIQEINPKTKKPYTNAEFTKKYFDPKYVKVNDNSEVMKIVDNALALPKFKNVLITNNNKGRQELVNYIKKQLSPDSTVNGYNKMLKSNEGMLKYMSEKMFDHVNNAMKSGKKGALEKAINNISYFLQMQTNLGGGWFRGLASHNAITLKRSGQLNLALKNRYRSEHEFQLANFTGNILLNTLNYAGNKSKFTEQVSPLIREFKQSIINKDLQEIIDSVESGGNTANIYSKEGMTLDVPAKANYLVERIIMESIVDLKTGKTFAEILDGRLQSGAGYKALQAASKKLNLPSKNVTTTEMARNLEIRDEAIRKGRLRNKKPRGISVFDFDETVGISDNYVIANRGGETRRISSAEWPFMGDKMMKEGWEMDFSDFNRVTDGKPGPLMQKMKNQIKKYGAKDVFILTARAAESRSAIHEYLKSEGIEIPIENITGLGNSTGEAKAMWMLEKFAEGYNDMYFVDDALPNVKAVKEVLDQLDIKSKVQQALASKNVNLEVNEIMKHSLGIEPEKTFSKAEGKIRGSNIKRRRLFMTDGAADFELLLEPLYGKGKKGVENQEWFKENIIKPFERGYNDLNNAKQKATNEYMELRKQNKDIVKSLDKEVAGTSFTTDMAMRVYIWNKSGMKIPDLAKSTQDKLVNEIKNNPKLRAFAESVARITGIEGGLKEPTAEWWTDTIAGEISGLSEGVSRKKHLAEFIDVKNEIFSEENLNKIESKLGTNWRRNLEDMLDRMETGRTRSANLGEGGNAILNYLNGSVGTIMNLNTRSATLQLISSVNFINHSFNNPLAATRAFANQPQYWKDFMTIMNSNMLKQRRAGLQINVTEAELAAAAAGTKNPAKAVLAKILKAGYAPTKIADSFAIASGGATYYRNAIRKYMKEGLSKAEAEKKAFVDFQAIAERTQQSSRPDLLSAQQVSVAGRIILPFANTPMQMNRIMMKELLDLKNGRYKGSFGDNSVSNKMSKVAYYGFVQSAIFAGLQSGLYALTAFGDDDELKQQKKVYAANTIADSFLRGMGIQGAVMAGIKNAALEFQTQNNKGFGADYSEVGEDLLNISPTIGSKFTKMDAAGNTYKYNKKKILAEGLTLDGPAMQGLTMAVEAIGNVPVNRLYRKIENIRGAMNDQNETYQRVLMGLGWSKWDVGVGQRERAEEKVKEKIQKEKDKKARRCTAFKSDGRRCKNTAKAGESKCWAHK